MSAEFLPVGSVSTFREVLPRSVCMAQPPRFTFGDFPADVAAQYYGALHISPVGVYAGNGLELCDGHVIHHDDALVVAPDLKLFPKHLRDVPAEREAGFQKRPRHRVKARAAWIVSPGHLIYGHWLAEILPRLGVLEAAGETLDSLVFPVPADTPKFALELLHLCGVPKSQILVYGADEVVAPDELLMPTLMHNGVRYSPLLADTVALFKRGVERAGFSLTAKDSPARIFLVRTGGNRRLVNREAIQAMAEAAGFVTVRPETMSLPAQIALFGSVREIVGEYGSAFHTALFSPPGTIVAGLRGSQSHPGFLQSAMGEVLGQPTGYVFGKTGTGKQMHDYTVAEADFASCLKVAFNPNANIALHKVAAKHVEKPASFPPPDRPGWVQPPEPKRGFWERFAKPKAEGAKVAPGSLYSDLLDKK